MVFPHIWGVCMSPPPLLRISSGGAAFVEMGLISILVGAAGVGVPAGPRFYGLWSMIPVWGPVV